MLNRHDYYRMVTGMVVQDALHKYIQTLNVNFEVHAPQ
jgi:hypothetical protein